MGERGHTARGRVLDAGALIAIERADARLRALLADTARPLIVPAPVVAEVWREGARQALLARVINGPRTTIEVFDEHVAKAAGVLLGRTGTSDIADASVVLAARRHEALVLTTDADDIRRLDPALPVEEL